MLDGCNNPCVSSLKYQFSFGHRCMHLWRLLWGPSHPPKHSDLRSAYWGFKFLRTTWYTRWTTFVRWITFVFHMWLVWIRFKSLYSIEDRETSNTQPTLVTTLDIGLSCQPAQYNASFILMGTKQVRIPEHCQCSALLQLHVWVVMRSLAQVHKPDQNKHHTMLNRNHGADFFKHSTFGGVWIRGSNIYEVWSFTYLTTSLF